MNFLIKSWLFMIAKDKSQFRPTIYKVYIQYKKGNTNTN